MKKNFCKVFLLLICVITLLTSIPVTSSASEPYQTYTYSIDGEALYSPAAYSPVMTVDSKYMGLLEDGGIPMDDPTDLLADKKGNIYIADKKNNRIIVTDKFYKLKFTINEFSNQYGARDALSAPQGLFVNDEFIYVCDTANSRIVVFDLDGEFVKIIPKPESELFGKGATYKPIAMAVDQYGRIFVISSTTYQGVIVMTDDGTFTGFIGAQKVVYSPIDIIWRRFMSEKQRKLSTTYVSTEFNNITVDDEGFIYVTTDAIEEDKQLEAVKSKNPDYSPVKKLNSRGTEIMRRNGFFDPGGDVDVSTASTAVIKGVSQIKDVAVGPQNTWTIIDAKRSKSFTYDQNGNLLFAFGDIGEILGQLKSVVGVTYQGDYMLMLDGVADSFTVYRRTNYGDLLIAAIKCENDRDYSLAIDAWENVLRYNNNFDTAYIGVGKAFYRDGDFKQSMEYFKAAYETDNYSNSFREVRKNWISKYFILIPIILVAVIVVITKLLGAAAKKNAAVAVRPGKKSYGEELVYAFHLMFHPFDGFWDLKHEKRGSVRAALTIIIVTVLAFFYRSIGRSYIENPKGGFSTVWMEAVSVFVPIMLFVVANWCLTTLFDGEGSFKDIFIAVGYSLSPMPAILVACTLASNVLTADEVGILSLFISIAFVWAGLLLFFGTMITHDYTMVKNIFIVLFTILGMAIIIFLAVLFSGLIAKMISFVSSIIVEISYRL